MPSVNGYCPGRFYSQLFPAVNWAKTACEAILTSSQGLKHLCRKVILMVLRDRLGLINVFTSNRD